MDVDGTRVSPAYPRMDDAPWKELRLSQEAAGEIPALGFRLAMNRYGWPVLSGTCPARERRKPIVYEEPFNLHGGYLYDVAKLRPEALPDLPTKMEEAAPGARNRRLWLTMDDGTVHEKDVPHDVFSKIAERLTTAMQAQFRHDTRLRREMRRPEYRIFAAIRANDPSTVKALVAADPTMVNAVAPDKPADTKWMSPLEVALSAGDLRDPIWFTEVNWKRDIAWFLLSHGADVNYQSPRTYLSFDAPVLFAATVNAVRNVRQHRTVGDRSASFVLTRTKGESDDAFAFLQAMIGQGADVGALDHDGRNVLREALWEAGKIAHAADDEMRTDLLRIFRLLIEAGADRENVVARTGQNLRESFADDAIWPICAKLFD